ncbi:MAG: OmpA family protein [Bacteroidales bacterium]|nr:OmpA family protein [Bacteroidales bacterium]MBN2818325.1 OmpA family protein [Bacteroidales bacterium]
MNRFIRKTILIILFLSGFLLSGYSQNYKQLPVKIKRKEFKQEEYGFKEAWRAVREANWLYVAGPGSYREARDYYLDAYKYNENNPELNYMIGRCYLFTDNKFESIKYIQKAFQLKQKVSFDIHLMLAMAYHQVNEFDNAIEEYNMFLKNLPSKEVERYQEQINMYIRQCKHGRDLVLDPVRVVINNLGENINTIFDEYSAVLPSDGSELYFTSRRRLDEKSSRSIIDDKFFEDIFYSEFKDGKWTMAQRISDKIVGKKNRTHIAIVGMSDTKDKLYLYKGKENEGDLYYTEFDKGKWKKPKPLKKFESKNRETSMCISSNGQRLYFISNIDKDSYGGTDIYFCTKNAKGKWNKPQNIGNTINTFWDEVGVSLSANDSVLYFSSKGHNSMGGYDVFKSELGNVNLWSKPVNLGYPVNTPNDDIFYSVMPDNKTAYYSTNRESGIGGMDIYKVIYLGSEKQMYVSYLEDPIKGIKDPVDDIYFEKSKLLDIDTRLLMRGFVTDSENQEPVKAKIELIDQETNESVAVAICDSTGNYSLRIPESKKYGVDINASGYLMFLDILDLTAATYDEVIVRNFELERVEVGAKVVLQNIYFETGKSNLLPESYATLHSVVRLLENNPTLRLEISGHTDNVGSAKSNLKLSNDRAKSCVDFIVQGGIAAERLEYKGYGYESPIAPNNTPEGRAQNRRVEFKILSK